MGAGTWKELESAVGWWVLGVVIGGLSGDAAGALAGAWPLLLAVCLGSALGALAAAFLLCRRQPTIDAHEFRAQEELIGEMVDQLIGLDTDVRSLKYQKVGSAMHLPGLDRLQ
jgi:hypothetical protein